MQLFPRVGWLHMQNRPDHMSCYYTYFPLALLPLEVLALGVDSCYMTPTPAALLPTWRFPTRLADNAYSVDASFSGYHRDRRAFSEGNMSASEWSNGPCPPIIVKWSGFHRCAHRNQ